MDEFFSTLGLREKEAETFLKLLSLGAQPVSVIAKHVGIPRSSMYFIMEKLQARGLIDVFERAGIRYVKCIPVKNIPDVLKAEERYIKHAQSLLQEKLPALQALESTISVLPKVKFNEGKEAVLSMYQSLARERRLYAFFNPAVVQSILPAAISVIADFLEEGGEAKEIVVDSKDGRAYRDRYHSRRHQIKIFPGSVTFLSDTILCKDRICMVTYGEDEIAAIEIFSQTLATTQRTIFEQLWESLV